MRKLRLTEVNRFAHGPSSWSGWAMLNLRCCSGAVGLEPGMVGSSEKGEWLQPGEQVNSSREAAAGEKRGEVEAQRMGNPRERRVSFYFPSEVGRRGKEKKERKKRGMSQNGRNITRREGERDRERVSPSRRKWNLAMPDTAEESGVVKTNCWLPLEGNCLRERNFRGMEGKPFLQGAEEQTGGNRREWASAICSIKEPGWEK